MYRFNKNMEFEREWLETDKRGGYASSTLALCNTRRYHGLFITPVDGYEGRYLLLSGVEPVLKKGEKIYQFSNSQYPGTVHPEGYRFLKSFQDYPFPSWNYKADDNIFNLEIFMTDSDGLVIKMENRSKKTAGEDDTRLFLNFLFSFRNIHHLTHENSDINEKISQDSSGSYIFRPYFSLPAVYISFSRKINYAEAPSWINNTEYLKELQRGFDFREDRFLPGTFSTAFPPGSEVYIGVSLDPASVKEEELHAYYEDIYINEKKKRQEIRKKYSRSGNSSLKKLKENARHFFIRNSEGKLSVIAGYPWFGEWGRDTMISLPGLTFYNQDTDKGIEILEAYSSYLKDGLLPNTLSGAQGFESYNSIDAGLLYIWAVQQLWLSGGKKAASGFYSFISEIIEAFIDNRVPGASLDSSGFIEAGNEFTQLTWMDAMVDNKPVTPRGGYPVDINALWYNGIKFFIEVSRYRKNKIRAELVGLSEQIEKNFIDRYWIEEGGYLADTVFRGEKDLSVRPNMIWAVSLPYTCLGKKQMQMVMEKCGKELLTGFGIRTLSILDPSYEGDYSGNGAERDRKYHQGTVWPWLFGIYSEGALRASDNPEKKALEIESLLDDFLDKHLYRNGYGFVSEIFNGTEPDEGKGAFAQAWSSGEIIRSYALIEQAKKGTFNDKR